MKKQINDFVNDYIAQEQQVQPSPFLAGKIMQRIQDTDQHEVQNRKAIVWQRLAIAASIAVVIGMGIALGNSYQIKTQDNHVLLINDNDMEHLYIYRKAQNG
ncbi:MAG: hypothetical protein LBU91_09625 [Bacteroidales bacterium]|jgi:hypothetical protein|nr:hypothetical protein [Bacteroidales bacterium]